MRTSVCCIPVVETDNGLCRLDNGIENHKYDREKVAHDTECCHSVRTEVTHEHIVPGQHHHTDGCLSQECRESQTNDISAITCRELYTLPAEL